MPSYIAYNSKTAKITDDILFSDSPIVVYPNLRAVLNNFECRDHLFTLFAEVETNNKNLFDCKDLFDHAENEKYPYFTCVKIVKIFTHNEAIQLLSNYVSSISLRTHRINYKSNSIAAADELNNNVVTYGDESIAAVTGSNSIATAEGIQSVAIAGGSSSFAEATGKNSIAVACNPAAARGKLGNFLIFINYDELGNIEEIRTQEVDGKTIKPDTCYRYNNGEFHEVEI